MVDCREINDNDDNVVPNEQDQGQMQRKSDRDGGAEKNDIGIDNAATAPVTDDNNYDNTNCSESGHYSSIDKVNADDFTSTGYTPLHETNIMSAMMMMNSTTEKGAESNDECDDDGMAMANMSSLVFTMAPPPTTDDDNDNKCDYNNSEWDFEDDPRHGEEHLRIEKDSEHESSKAAATQGAFYANFDHLSQQKHGQYEQYHMLNVDDGITATNEDNTNQIPFDYKTIAEQALQNLVDDYTSTLTVTATESSPISPKRETENTNDSFAVASTSVKASDEDLNKHVNLDNDNVVFNANFDEEQDLMQQKQEEITPTNMKKPEATDTMNMDINKKAISYAMNKIRLKASSSLISKLDSGPGTNVHATDNGDNDNDNNTNNSANNGKNTSYTKNKSYPLVHVPDQHPIIPSKPLLAFCRGNTEKSIDATSRLTRSATLADGIIRIFESESIVQSLLERPHNNDGVFVIHVVGADHVECSTKETVEQAVGPFVQWWQKACKNQASTLPLSIREILSSFKHLRIELLGPNVPISSTKRKPTRLYPKKESSNAKKPITQNINLTGLQTATAICQNCLYHDYIQALRDEKDGGNDTTSPAKVGDLNTNEIAHQQYKRCAIPHCIIAYNAGVWGYDDWIPTIKAMKENLPVSTPFIVTSYTIQEAEDDADVIRDIFLDKESENNVDNEESYEEISLVKAMEEQFLIWGPTLNPFGSRKLREMVSSTGSRPYFENGAWQVWLMGKQQQ